MASVFNLSEHPVIAAFKQDAVSDVDMDNKEVQLKPEGLSNSFLSFIYETSSDFNPGGIRAIIASSTAGKSSCFSFHKGGKDNNFSLEGSCTCCTMKTLYIVAEKGYFQIRTDPAWGSYTRFSWKLVRLFQVNKDPNQQLYLIASVKYPAMFLSGATLRKEHLSVGDPGDLGYWYLDQSGVAEARVRREDNCLIL